MKRFALCILICALLVGCAEEVIKKPEDLIPREKMTNILYDISLLTSAKNTDRAVLFNHGIETMDYIYKKYDVDSVQFVKSDEYYASKPQEYQDIFESIKKRLDSLEQSFQKAREDKPAE